VIEEAQVLRDQNRLLEVDGNLIGGDPPPLDIGAARTGPFDECRGFRFGF
jgi:hypothetical protein